jgi:hypothetical protein
LRERVIESGLFLAADLAYMSAWGGLYSHSEADVEKGSQKINLMYFDALSRVPYMTRGRGGHEMLNVERAEAIERYREMKRRTLKPKSEQ